MKQEDILIDVNDEVRVEGFVQREVDEEAGWADEDPDDDVKEWRMKLILSFDDGTT